MTATTKGEANRTLPGPWRHTPAPWKMVQESVDPEWHIVTAVGGRIVANVHIGCGMDAANAALVVTAPELFEACKAWAELGWCAHAKKADDGACNCDWHKAVRAVAKVEGRS